MNNQEMFKNYSAKLGFDGEVSNDILNYLYLPITDSLSISLYRLLISEANNTSTRDIFMPQQRLTEILGITMSDLYISITKLENANLINIYKKDDGDHNAIIKVSKPLNTESFLTNETLKQMLENRIGKTNVEMNIKYISSNKAIDYSEYKDVTKEMNVDTDSLMKEIFSNSSQGVKQLLRLSNIDYDKFWTDDIEELVLSLISSETKSNSEIVSTIIKTIEEGEFTKEQFLAELHVSKEIFVEDVEGKELIDKTFERKFDVLQELSVPQFFELRIKRKPSQEEIENLTLTMTNNNWSNGFINLLVDYVAIKNEGIFVLNYLKKIVTSLLNKNIDTVETLKSYLTTAYKMSEAKTKPMTHKKVDEVLNRTEEPEPEMLQQEIEF